MALTRADIKLRPLKFGFVVDYQDDKAVLEAIKINSCLWGGVYNPIIPFLKRFPKNWERHRSKSKSVKDVFSGYLNNFDPDYIVPIGNISLDGYDCGPRVIVSPVDLIGNLIEDGQTGFGIGCFELLNKLVNDEYKYERRNPLKFLTPQVPEKYKLFFASLYGKLPEQVEKIFDENYQPTIKAKKAKITIKNYLQSLNSYDLFFRRLTGAFLKVSQNAGGREESIFLLDGESALDIMDYWNLRAIGWNVIPVITQSLGTSEYKKPVKSYINENFLPYRDNEEMYHSTGIIKARSVKETEMKRFVNSLGIKQPADIAKSKYFISSYPRMWDDWARDKDGAECCELSAKEEDYEISIEDDSVTLKTLDPNFGYRYSRSGNPCFANEISVSHYGTNELVAAVLPQAKDDLLRDSGFMVGLNEWRISKKGLVFLSQYRKWHIRVPVAKAEHIFLSWLKLNGWDARLSPAGKIGNQMLKKLGGTWGINIISNESLIKTLSTGANGKMIMKNTIFTQLSQHKDEYGFKGDPKKIIKRLTETNMLKLGLKVKCPTCAQSSWYSLKELNYDLYCSKCIETFKVPTNNPDAFEWAYKTFGPFSIPAKAYGIYTVLLALKLLVGRSIGSPATAILGFEAKKGEVDLEADLGVFLKESRFGVSKVELIFAECKTYNKFLQKDADRMRALAKAFPGAIIVFATLRKSLEDSERKLLAKVATQGRRYWKNDRPYNPVLILTGTELFSEISPEYAWKRASDKHKMFAQRFRMSNGLLEFCDMTQELYLGLKPWRQWLHEKWEKKRLQRQKKYAEKV